MLTLVLGGVRSGKSAVAEGLARDAARDGTVTYVATAEVDPADGDHVARVAAHRARRPLGWRTVEPPSGEALADLVAALDGTVLVDSLGTWLTRFPDCTPPPAAVTALVDALAGRDGHTVVVSEEAGLSPHAPSALGRRFVDALGSCNQAVSLRADRVLLVVAGRTLELPPC